MSKNNKKTKKKRNIFVRFLKFLLIVGILALILYGLGVTFNYILGYKTILNSDGTKSKVYVSKKSQINALICGTNQNLTDTIIYVNCNIETGKIFMMSIPRDTYVENDYCVGNKINAIYRGKNIAPLTKEIEELLDVNIDYYLIFDSSMLINLVDTIGGVEIDVPIRMKYDDPTQDLHIDLNQGIQVLDGKQAEGFVRYRKNNDGEGYAMGDLQRTKVQQNFIKKSITTTLSVKNIFKFPQIISIILDNTNTNIATNDILRYSTDVLKLDIDNIESCTAPGAPKYIKGVSYFLLDEKNVKELIKTKH